MSGLSNNTIYRLRVALTPQGTSNYFGSTYNGSSWYNGTPSPINYSNFLSITTDNSGSWSGTIQGKVELSDPNFPGSSATYDLKAGRYTETGTSPTWSNTLQIAVVAPSPAPSAAASPAPSFTPAPSTPQSESSFTISDVPSQINSDQVFAVKVNLSMPNSQNSDYYLKVAFKKADGTRYFGLTKVNNKWIEYGDDNENQYKITTNSSGNWTGNLEVKPDTNDSDYKGGGDYIFKVGRYTSGGSGPAWSNETTIKINGPTASPTSTLIPSGTKIPSFSPALVKSPTPKPSPSPEFSRQNASVAGAIASSAPEAEVEVKSQKQTNPLIWIGVFFIFAGVGLIGYIYFVKNAKIRKIRI